MGRFFGGRTIAAVALGLSMLPVNSFAQAVPTTRPTTQELAATTSAGNDWLTFGGALNNQRFSTLNQINTTNVAQLKGAWMTRLGSGKGSKYRFEPDPLVIDGVLYIPTGNDDVFALDAKTGKKIWEYFSDIPQVNDLICCGWDNRGVAAGEGKIFSGQLDASMVALDQKTGKIAWRTQLEDYRDGYSITGATRYFDGLVFTGMSGGENGIQGRFYALDAKTGQLVWRFNTVPNPGEIGSDTWPMNDPDPIKANIYKHGGGTVWQAPAIDPELGMLYFSTGNAGPWEGSLRPGLSLFTASIVALDYKTGQYKWHFQQVHHEIWDYDMPNSPALYDTVLNGQPRKGLYQAGKTGWLYFLDRTDGTPLIGIDEKPVPQEARQNTWPTQPYPQGDAFVRQCPEPDPNFPLAGCIFTPYWDVPVLTLPSAGGGSNYNPTCYNPSTGYVYVMGNESDTAHMVQDNVQFELGKRYTRVASALPLGHTISSTFTAMDSKTNKIAWQERKPGSDNKGCVTSAGGVVFSGQIDGNLVAYDAASGNRLWTFQTGWGIGAPPMTYAVDGKQYVVVASGGNRGGVTTLDGDAVWAFALDGNIDQVPAPPAIQTKVEITGAPVAIGRPMGRPQDPGGERIFEGALDMIDYDYFPRRIQVPVGTTVTWDNRGAVIHTATDTKGAWDTGDVKSGESGSVNFPSAGTFTYSCSPHPWMLGQVIVQ
jgi:quinohemoprotein ethanol dehydrogenase